MRAFYSLVVGGAFLAAVGCSTESLNSRGTGKVEPKLTQNGIAPGRDNSPSPAQSAVTVSKAAGAANVEAKATPSAESCIQPIYISAIDLPVPAAPSLTEQVLSYSTSNTCGSVFAFNIYKLDGKACVLSEGMSQVTSLKHPTRPGLSYLTANEVESARLQDDGWLAQGVVGAVATARSNSGSMAAIFHLLDTRNGSHLFTTSFPVLDASRQNPAYAQQSALGFVKSSIINSLPQTANQSVPSALSLRVCQEISRWRDSDAGAEESTAWTKWLSGDQPALYSDFAAILAIDGTYGIAAGRAPTEAEFNFWFPEVATGRINASQFRRIVLISSAYTAKCSRSNTPAEFAIWNPYLIENGDGKLAFKKMKSLINCQ